MLAIAAYHNSRDPQYVDLPEPRAPHAGEVLCRTLQLGVCGTDRDILHGARPWTPPGESFLVLGHECLGRVEQVGGGVDELAVGDLVVPVVRRAIGDSARPDLLAFGQYTERGIVREHGFSAPWWLDRPEYLFTVPGNLHAVAVFTEPLSVTEKGINEACTIQRARLGEETWQAAPPRVLVTGMGPIGFAALLGCVSRGWPVTMYGRDRRDTFRAQQAQALGARYVPADNLASEPADVERDGYDLILECTGSDTVMLRAASQLASRGALVWLGSSRAQQPKLHNLDRLMRHGVLRNHLHLGCVNAAPRDFQQALQRLEQQYAARPHSIDALLTARVPANDALWHYQHRQAQGIKTVLMYGE